MDHYQGGRIFQNKIKVRLTPSNILLLCRSVFSEVLHPNKEREKRTFDPYGLNIREETF